VEAVRREAGVHREAGARQEDERRRQRNNQPEGHAERMSGGGNATTSQTRGTGGHGATRGDGVMRGGVKILSSLGKAKNYR
jgi:hypothetical protein